LADRGWIAERQVKALAWHGKGDIRCESVPDPKIEHPREAIIKVTTCAICGSDLHIFDGVVGDNAAPEPWQNAQDRE
jgi:threonine dehydrogenase-like Zn-dependent dehydrogenase